MDQAQGQDRGAMGRRLAGRSAYVLDLFATPLAQIVEEGRAGAGGGGGLEKRRGRPEQRGGRERHDEVVRTNSTRIPSLSLHSPPAPRQTASTQDGNRGLHDDEASHSVLDDSYSHHYTC